MVTERPNGDDVARVRLDKTRVLASVSRLAAERGIRVIAAGGPVFAVQGLISPRLLRTASVIVDVAAFEEFVLALFRAGWVLVPLGRRVSTLPSVVFSFDNPEWVVRLAVYTVFPGFYVDPRRVFAILWARRQIMTLHGTKVLILDRLSTIIMAVHDRLGTHAWTTKDHNYERYLIDQFRRTLRPPELKELLELVRALVAVEPMRPLLNALGLDAGEITLPNESYAKWRLAIPSASPATLAMLALVECPPARRVPQTLRVLRESPATVARAVLGAPHASWLILTARRRMRARYRELQLLAQ